MKPIDLHIYTTASDGIFSSKEVVDLAINEGVEIIAITDHDSVSGIKQALEYSKDKNIIVIPGVEISCKEEEVNISHLHIVGLFIDYENLELNRLLEKEEKCRIEQAVDVIEKAKGISILAHPLIYTEYMEEIIEKFIKAGGKGIETNYYYREFIGLDEVEEKLSKKFKRILKGKNLIFSGGSDFHGDLEEIKIGIRGIKEEDFEKLCKGTSFHT